MQVVVSMYFETVGVLRKPERLPQTDEEERRISRLCVAMTDLPSDFLELDEEGLELRRPGVRVHGRRSQVIRERARVSGVSRGVPPVEREANLPDLLAVHAEGPQPFCDPRAALHGARSRGYLHLRAVGDSLLPGEGFRNLDEESRLKLVQD